MALSGALKRKKLQVVAAYSIATIYNLLNLFQGFFTDEIVYRSGYAYPRPVGLIYFSYFIFFATLVTCGLIVLWKTLASLSRYQARGLRLFILATALGYLGGLNNFLIMIDVRLFPLFPHGLYAVALYGVVASFFVHRYSLLRLQSVEPGVDKPASPRNSILQSSDALLEVDALSEQ